MPKLAKGKTYGKIMDKNNKGLQGFKVELWDNDYPDSKSTIRILKINTNSKLQS